MGIFIDLVLVLNLVLVCLQNINVFNFQDPQTFKISYNFFPISNNIYFKMNQKTSYMYTYDHNNLLIRYLRFS